MILRNTPTYEVHFDEIELRGIIYVKDPRLRRKLKAQMLYTFDGRKWIKTSGGRSVSTQKLMDVLRIPAETMEKIRKLLAGD